VGFSMAEALSECPGMVRPPGVVNMTSYFSSPSTESPLHLLERARVRPGEGDSRYSSLSLTFEL